MIEICHTIKARLLAIAQTNVALIEERKQAKFDSKIVQH